MFEELIPELRPFAQELLDVAARAGVGFTVTSTRRSHAAQTKLYRAFLRGETKYPVAPPGASAHEFGYAFDGVSQVPEYQADFGQVWQSWGGVWSAKDEVHFEYPGFTPQQPDWTPTLVQQVAEKYVDAPWWATILLPVSATAEKGTLAEASRGSLGARALCALGAREFC